MQGPPPRLLSLSCPTRRSLYRSDSGDWADSPAGATEAAQPADCRISGVGWPGLSALAPPRRSAPPTPAAPSPEPGCRWRCVWFYCPRRVPSVPAPGPTRAASSRSRERGLHSRGPLLHGAQAPEPRVISSSARVTCLGKPVAPGLASSARLGLRRLQPPGSSLPESQPPHASQTVRTHGVLRQGRAAGSSVFSPGLCQGC